MRSLSWRQVLQIAVSATVLIVFVLLVDWRQAKSLLGRADPWLLLSLAVLYPADRFFMAWKWHIVARAAPTCVSLWTGTRIYFASSAVGIFLPLGGLGPDVVRVAMLGRHGMAVESSVSSILVERICGIAGSVLMLGLACVLLLYLAPGTIENAWVSLSTWWIAPVLGLTVVVLMWLMRSATGRRIRARVVAHRRLNKYAVAFGVMGRRPALVALSVLLSWLEQWAPILAFYIAFRGFDVDVSLLECAAIIPLGSILERLPISVGGIGVKEAGIVMAAGLVGVGTSEAFIVSLFEHTMFVLTMMPMALIYWVHRGEARQDVKVTL